MRLTVGDAKGKPLSDKRQLLSNFFTAEDLATQPITLVFKDMGRQISWKVVFLIEYFGPMLISAILIAF